LRRACEITGASESNLVVSCVESLVNYVESHGEITLPIVVVPKSVLEQPGTTSILIQSKDRAPGKSFAKGVQASPRRNKSARNSDSVAANRERQVPPPKTHTTQQTKTRPAS
jgi:hypothetical protein